MMEGKGMHQEMLSGSVPRVSCDKYIQPQPQSIPATTVAERDVDVGSVKPSPQLSRAYHHSMRTTQPNL